MLKAKNMSELLRRADTDASTNIMLVPAGAEAPRDRWHCTSGSGPAVGVIVAPHLILHADLDLLRESVTAWIVDRSGVTTRPPKIFTHFFRSSHNIHLLSQVSTYVFGCIE